jgi:hypothetical protein
VTQGVVNSLSEITILTAVTVHHRKVFWLTRNCDANVDFASEGMGLYHRLGFNPGEKMQDVLQIRKMVVMISNKRSEEFRCLGQSFWTDTTFLEITAKLRRMQDKHH